MHPVNEPTVLVLGAGASFPYRFPLGSSLYDAVLESDQPWLNGVLQEVLGRGAGAILIEFRHALGASGWESVDSFLASRQDFIEVGKASIAAVIMMAETRSNEHLFTADRKDDEGVRRGKWYKHLRASIPFEPDTYQKNNLSIITFNYDRSLEHFLHSAIMYSHRKDEKEAAEILDGVPIIHLHGQLGKLPWQDAATGRAYGSEVTAATVRHYSKEILIVSEEIEKQPDYPIAVRLLQKARCIHFLGFGFDPANLKRITSDIRNAAYLGGTAIGLSSFDRSHLEGQFFDRREFTKQFLTQYDWPRSKEIHGHGIGIDLAPHDMNILEYLRNWVKFV